jgi:hypothetical protein
MTEEELNSLWLNKSLCNDGKRFAGPESLHDAMMAFNAVAKEVAAKENIHFIEVGNKIESNPEFFIDDVHYTTHGAQALAMVILNYFNKHRIGSCDENSGAVPITGSPAPAISPS